MLPTFWFCCVWHKRLILFCQICHHAPCLPIQVTRKQSRQDETSYANLLFQNREWTLDPTPLHFVFSWIAVQKMLLLHFYKTKLKAIQLGKKPPGKQTKLNLFTAAFGTESMSAQWVKTLPQSQWNLFFCRGQVKIMELLKLSKSLSEAAWCIMFV